MSTVDARTFAKYLDAAQARGADPEALVAAAGLTGTPPYPRDDRAPVTRLFDLQRECVRATSPEFALSLGAASDLRAFDIMGYVALCSTTVGEALDRLGRFFRLWQDGATLRVSVDDIGARVEYVVGSDAHEMARHDVEYTLASIARSVTQLTGAEVNILHVSCRHRAPVSDADYRRVFGVSPVFNSTLNAVWVAPSVLLQPVPTADPTLASLLVRQGDAMMAARPPTPDLVTESMSVIAARLPSGVPRLQDVARSMGMSSRTLQRRLQTLGASWREVVDQTRHRSALQYLDGDLGLCEVAFLLGYAEPSAFHRAFRRWTGETPNQRRLRTSSQDVG